MKRKYFGGNRVGKQLYVRCGSVWIEILALAVMEEEEKRFGPYTI